MKGLLRSCLLLATVCCVFPASSAGFEFPRSHSMSVGGVPILSNLVPSDLVELPGGATDRYAVGFESGYQRRYDLGDLDRVFVAAAGTYGRFVGGIGVAQFGKSDLYAEKTIKATLGYLIRDITIGGSVSAMRAEFGGNYGQFSKATVGLGAGYGKGQFRGLVAADNLTNPKLVKSSEPYRRITTAIAEWTTRKQLSTVVRVTKRERESAKYSIGQRIPLARGSALYWGISTRPVEYGGGVDIATKLFTLTYGAKIHPVLGLSHSVSVSILKSRAQDQPTQNPANGDE